MAALSTDSAGPQSPGCCGGGCCGGGLFPWCCRYAAALSTDSAGPQSPGCCDGGCCCGGGCRGDCVERGEEVPVSPLPGNAAALSTDNAGPQSRLKVQYDATVRCAKAERYADVHSVEDLIREIWDDQRLLLFVPIRRSQKTGCPVLAAVDLSGMIVSCRLAFQSERSRMIKGYCSLLQSEISKNRLSCSCCC